MSLTSSILQHAQRGIWKAKRLRLGFRRERGAVHFAFERESFPSSLCDIKITISSSGRHWPFCPHHHIMNRGQLSPASFLWIWLPAADLPAERLPWFWTEAKTWRLCVVGHSQSWCSFPFWNKMNVPQMRGSGALYGAGILGLRRGLSGWCDWCASMRIWACSPKPI